MSAPIILLKEGTEQAQGKRQILSNIQACQVVADAVRTTLGPRGMDKLIVEKGGKTTISNDGATILKLLDIVLPAAKTLVDVAKSQDAEVGDGTTTVVLLAAELLKHAKPFIDDGVHPQTVIRAYRKGAALAGAKLNELAVNLDSADAAAQKDLLIKCAMTALSSKLLATQKLYFAQMVVDAVGHLGELMPMKMIGIKKVHGGSVEDSQLVRGIAFKKTFSYAGFEMQPKSYDKPKLALLNIELELKAEKENAEIRIQNVTEYQQVVDAEWQILYGKLQKLHESGAKVVLSKLPIGDVATQWFADRDMFCAGRVVDEDMVRTLEACGGSVLTSVNQMSDATLGRCERFHEQQVGNERYNFFVGCAKARACTVILRGGAEQFIDETERSLRDAIMIVRRTTKNDAVVAGGGAIDMELSRHVREVSKSIAGKEQLILAAYARAFEVLPSPSSVGKGALQVIPQQLCHNGGLDATEYLNKLRHRHAKDETWIGIDMQNETLTDNMQACVLEPVLVKLNAVSAATEAACLILSVDQTIKNPKNKGAEMGE